MNLMLNKIKLFKVDDVSDFLPLNVEIEEKGANPIGKTILWLVLSLFTLLLMWTCFAEIDVVISTQGKVIPDGEIKIIQPTKAGVISSISVVDGDSVKKGDILMVIDSTINESIIHNKKERVFLLKEIEKRLVNLINIENQTFKKHIIINQEQIQHQNSQQEMYLNKIEQLNSKIEQIYFKTKNEEYQKNVLLLMFKEYKENYLNIQKVKDLLSKKEIDAVVIKYLETEKDLKAIEETLKIQKALKKELEKERDGFKESFKNDLYGELQKCLEETKQLETEIINLEYDSKQQIITSPYDGIVVKVNVNTINGYVREGDKIMTILPEETPLVIQNFVLNKDIGFVKEDMETKIKIDTYSFQKYGFLSGKVKKISNYSIEDEKKGIVYETKISFDKNSFLMVDGKEKRLEPGMTTQNEIKIGKRKVITFFIYPLIQYFDEGLSVK